MRFLIPFILVLVTAVAPRVISDKRPLPKSVAANEKAAEEINRCRKGYELAFDSTGYAQRSAEDTVRLSAPRFSGYDKGLNFSKESFFVTNNGEDRLTEVTVDITYLTTSGEMLHKRRVTQKLSVPSGETRRVDIPTWDTQHQFYYHLTAPAPKRTATPFRVRLTPVRATYLPR